VSPSHRVQFFTNCPSVGPFHRVQPFRSRLLQRGSFGQDHKSCQQTCSQPPSGIHLLRHGVFHGLQVEICFTMDLLGLQGHSLHHHGLHHWLKRKNLCSGFWSTSSSFFTDLGERRVVSFT